MESNYSNRDFEQFVKQNADQYRMFPSEKVWKGVHNALHTRRRWYGFGLALVLLLTGGAVTLVMKSYPVSKNQQDIAAIKTNLSLVPADEPVSSSTPKDIKELLPFDRHPAEREAPVVAATSQIEEYAYINNIFESPAVRPEQPAVINLTTHLHPFSPAEGVERTITINNKPGNLGLLTPVSATRSSASSSSIVAETVIETTKKSVAATLNKTAWNAEPYQLLTIESVTNQYKAPAKRLSWQLFVTPTISYRKLGENKSFSGSSSLAYPFASLSDVNNAVTHKPDIGLQIGFSARYPITKSLKVLAGLQFNINRYDIKAFANPGEVAVINLDDAGNNTVSTWTYYRSQSGYKSDWLKNFYFSVSLPVGAEMKLFGNKKTSFGIAGTIQPTYIIKERAYLISTDYKNYAEVPWLVRRMNVSTGFETFVNYTKGKTRWQIGPQVRYQLLSSFQNKYPVKENLFDFGVKVGVTLNQ